jgi:NADP-dependent 3-hydroxy acid dehydrogenase YdfG
MSTVITAAPLAGRVAIVTGASSGIGEATAFRLATLGAKVALAARRTDNLEALAARITAAGGTALVLPLDVTDRSAVNAAAQQGCGSARPGRSGLQQCRCSTDLTHRRPEGR